MYELTGAVVGYDDFLPLANIRDPGLRQFHVVVEEDVSGERVRLRAGSGIVPLHLSDFGKSVKLDDVRALLGMGSRITFSYRNVADAERADPNFHPMDVIVYQPSTIVVARCQTIAFVPRSRGEAVDPA